MSEDSLPFLWENFIEEKRGAVEQVMIFVQQIAFEEFLYPFLTPEESTYLGIVDTDLRLTIKPFSSIFEELTIDVD